MWAIGVQVIVGSGVNVVPMISRSTAIDIPDEKTCLFFNNNFRDRTAWN